MYLLHNNARNAATRFDRARNPVNKGKKQFVIDQNSTMYRVIPNKPIFLTQEQLMHMLPDLIEREKKGWVHVTLAVGGAHVNLQTLQVEDLRVPDQPHPVLEVPVGALDMTGLHQRPRSKFEEEEAPPQEFTMPVPPPDAAISNPVVKSVETNTPVQLSHKGRRKGKANELNATLASLATVVPRPEPAGSNE